MVCSPLLTPSLDGRLTESLPVLSLISRWRSQFRTDRLYSEINFVLSRFCQPFYELFGHVDRLLSTPASQPLPPNASIELLAQALLLLTELFHDLNSQDLPPFFEEHLDDFMGNEATGKEGWLRKYLSWERPELKGDVSDNLEFPLTSRTMMMCPDR
jgi:exportin-2 (importin alpha re-exporter)